MDVIYKHHIDKNRRNTVKVAKRRETIKCLKKHEFISGSKHEGVWGSIGMKGYGSYKFFYGVDYDGDFYDSVFHERGTLMYRNTAKMDGFWNNGHMIAHRYFYPDNLCYGPYCEMPDRRYYIEIKQELGPAGRSFLTNSYEARTIPRGCYDTGDGFYDPVKKCVYAADDPTKIIRIPTNDQHTWITQNCRKAWDEPVGYKPRLYENWQKDDSDIDSNHSERSRTRKSIDYLCYRRNSRLKAY